MLSTIQIFGESLDINSNRRSVSKSWLVSRKISQWVLIIHYRIEYWIVWLKVFIIQGILNFINRVLLASFLWILTFICLSLTHSLMRLLQLFLSLPELMFQLFFRLNWFFSSLIFFLRNSKLDGFFLTWFKLKLKNSLLFDLALSLLMGGTLLSLLGFENNVLYL